MKTFRLFQLLPVLTAGLLLALSATGFADRKVTVYRDNDGDGHYNKKTYTTNGNRYYNGPYYNNGRNYYSGRPYGYGYGYYNRPYSYYRPYPYYYSRPSVGFSYSRSVYPSTRSSYSDVLAVDVQRELQRRGYYRGPIDGDVGPGTRAAIRAYQDDRGIAVTGRIDRPLLRSLGVS